MPEIIEVEITKQKLTPALVRRRILEFFCDWPRGLTSEFGGVNKTALDIKGRTITSLGRKGKVVLIDLSGDRQLAIHQRMSGHLALLISAGAAYKHKHAHFIFTLSNNKILTLIDPRKFGTAWYGTPKFIESIPYMKNLGPDALTISQNELSVLCQNNKSILKSMLLRQDKIAGLGNIMVDEILWRARLSPKRKAYTLSLDELRSMHKSLKQTLAASLLHGGTSMSDWFHPDATLGAYQKHFKIYKQKCCSRCASGIKRQVVGGRGTYICTSCQA